MVEGRIPSHLPRQEFPGEQAHKVRDATTGTEDVAGHGHQAVGDRRRDAALGTGFIDRGADRLRLISDFTATATASRSQG